MLVKFKPVVKWFIFIELLDITTTNIGILIGGFYEINTLLNPWPLGILIKVIGIAIVAIIMQKIRKYKANILIPILAAIAIPWNIYQLLKGVI